MKIYTNFKYLVTAAFKKKKKKSKQNKIKNKRLTKMVKKDIANVDSSRASVPDCIPVVVLKNCEPELSYILAELFQYLSERVLFYRLLKGLVSGSCIKECWGKVHC